MEKTKKASKRTGVNRSIYISEAAAEVLRACRKATKRSQSSIISLILERYGLEVVEDPDVLNERREGGR